MFESQRMVELEMRLEKFELGRMRSRGMKNSEQPELEQYLREMKL